MDRFPESGIVVAALQRAADYLVARQTPSGGFCFYRWGGIEEPNLADTDHALSALQRLDLPVPNADRVAAFADRFRGSAQPDALLHLVGIDRALGRNPAADAALCGVVAALSPPASPQVDGGPVDVWLRRVRLFVDLRRRVGVACDGERLLADLERLLHGGGFGTPPNLIDTRTALEIADCCGRPLRRDDIRQFVDALQVPVLAFTSTLTSRMGRLDLIASGVASCALLGLPLRHRGDALRFILDCQSDSGGFANAPGALPDIERTAAAIDIVLELTANA